MSIKVIPRYNYSGLMDMYLNQDSILNNIDDTNKDDDIDAFEKTCKRFTKRIEIMNNIVTTLERKNYTLSDKAKIDEIVKKSNAGCENYVPLFTFLHKEQRIRLEKKLQQFRNINHFEYIFPIIEEYNNQLVIVDFKSHTLYDSLIFWEVNKKAMN